MPIARSDRSLEAWGVDGSELKQVPNRLASDPLNTRFIPLRETGAKIVRGPLDVAGNQSGVDTREGIARGEVAFRWKTRDERSGQSRWKVLS